MIKFDELSHTYTNTNTGSVYKSVTTLLGEYKKPFESDIHAERVSKREGVSKEFILELWQAETKKATDKGTKIHKLMEDYIKEGIVIDQFKNLYDSYNEIVSEKIPYFNSVNSEELLFSHEYEIAGTADLIYNHREHFTVGDFKTNKNFRFKSDFNEYLLPPVSHLSYCEFNTYALQLSLYAYMNECLTNKRCSGLVIFYLANNRWISYNVNYLRSDVINILNNYKYKHEIV